MPCDIRSTTDVLIVGAGPAGSHLACQIARQGLDVTLIDKAAFPRDKVCGGGLSRKSLRLLDLDLSPVLHKRVTGAILNWRNQDAVIKDIDPPVGCTVTRLEFDHLLLERARAAGARFLSETGFIDLKEEQNALEVDTTRGRLRCRLLMAADGAASTVRAKAFGKNAVDYMPSLEALVTPRHEAAGHIGNRAVFDFGVMPGGYGWIFPKRDHFNVGVYSPHGSTSLRRHLDGFLNCYDSLRQATHVRYQGYVIPLRKRYGKFQQGRVWLLGDAAGLAEALFGEGIYFALKSAELAAEAIRKDGPEPGSDHYSRLLRRELLPELRASRWMAAMIYRHPEMAFRHLVRHPRVNTEFAAALAGETTYRQCLLRTALRFPYWLRPAPLEMTQYAL